MNQLLALLLELAGVLAVAVGATVGAWTVAWWLGLIVLGLLLIAAARVVV